MRSTGNLMNMTMNQICTKHNYHGYSIHNVRNQLIALLTSEKNNAQIDTLRHTKHQLPKSQQTKRIVCFCFFPGLGLTWSLETETPTFRVKLEFQIMWSWETSESIPNALKSRVSTLWRLPRRSFFD